MLSSLHGLPSGKNVHLGYPLKTVTGYKNRPSSSFTHKNNNACHKLEQWKQYDYCHHVSICIPPALDETITVDEGKQPFNAIVSYLSLHALLIFQSLFNL